MLRRTMTTAASNAAMHVNWVNQREEQYRPWDIELARIDAPGAVEMYVEVKSSTSLDKPFFEVSLAELEAARASSSRYLIFRVLGVGSPGVRVAALRDPLRHLGPNGTLSLLLATRGPAP
mmetsp:Transcript_25372/g.84518  ORF Transcript_25372/g.84518 Transcript_25372/m.84518 type:complete len:120 (+) Transcript_25372:1014-1373(+)